MVATFLYFKTFILLQHLSYCSSGIMCNTCCNLFYCSIYFYLLYMKPQLEVIIEAVGTGSGTSVDYFYVGPIHVCLVPNTL